MINEYDKIRLKTGQIGRILEILDSDAYIAEIFHSDGNVDTSEIRHTEIASVFKEIETPLGLVL